MSATRARARTALVVVAAVALTPAAGVSHEWWIEPARFALAPGDTVTIGASAGMGFRGERKIYSVGRAVRVSLVDEGGMRAHPPDGVPGTRVYTRLPATAFGGGAALVGLETGWSDITLEPAEFAGYVADEGLAETPGVALALAGGVPIRERYARCGRTWLRGGRGAQRPSGLTLEIVPLVDTPPVGRGGLLPVRVLLRGRPLAGATLKAWHRELATEQAPFPADARDSVGVAWSARTDRHGRARVPIGAPGEWLLATVHLEPCPVPRLADFQSHWASLTFAVTEPR
jgi:hypothetical protein